MSAAGEVYAEGGNYRAEVQPDGVLVCRVWKRPDLSAQEGAALANEMVAIWVRAADDALVLGLVHDLRDAPPVFGPQTEVAFGRMLAGLRDKKPAVLLVGTQAVQKLQLARIIAAHPKATVLAGSLEEASGWVLARSAPSSRARRGAP